MSDTIGDRSPAAAADMLVVACPTDASLNRVPRAKLDRNPNCGRCHNPLFQGKAVELNAANFNSHALKSDVPIVIDFWAEWCGPCRMMTPNFEMAVPRLEPRVARQTRHRGGTRDCPALRHSRHSEHGHDQKGAGGRSHVGRDADVGDCRLGRTGTPRGLRGCRASATVASAIASSLFRPNWEKAVWVSTAAAAELQLALFTRDHVLPSARTMCGT